MGGVMRDHCPAAIGCFTGDSKLSRYSTYFVEGQVALFLGFLDRPRLPLGRWLGSGVVAVSLGRYWNTNYANTQYGDAWVAGFDLSLPL